RWCRLISHVSGSRSAAGAVDLSRMDVVRGARLAIWSCGRDLQRLRITMYDQAVAPRIGECRYIRRAVEIAGELLERCRARLARVRGTPLGNRVVAVDDQQQARELSLIHRLRLG